MIDRIASSVAFTAPVSNPGPTGRTGANGSDARAAGTQGDFQPDADAASPETALSESDQRRVRELQQRDREVRAHELAHVSAGAGLVLRGASYDFETGPDGQRYAVGGEVTIDTSAGRTPEETIAKAEQIQSAALAPANPSSQDRQVAAQAAQMAAQARIEQALQERGRTSAAEAPSPRDEGRDAETRSDARVRNAYAASTALQPGGTVSEFA